MSSRREFISLLGGAAAVSLALQSSSRRFRSSIAASASGARGGRLVLRAR
jgi:hypothetical protein